VSVSLGSGIPTLGRIAPRYCDIDGKTDGACTFALPSCGQLGCGSGEFITVLTAHRRIVRVRSFGGVTAYSRSPAEGIWTSPDGNRERDAVLMVEVFTEQFDRAWWRAYQHSLAERFGQEEIHIRAIETHTP